MATAFKQADYNTFLQGKNVGSAEAERVAAWAKSQGWSGGDLQKAAGVKNVNSANDIRQMVAVVNQWGASRKAAPKPVAPFQAQNYAKPASPAPQPPAQQPPPAPPSQPPAGLPPAEQPNSAGSYNSQLLKMQLEQQAQSKAAENPAAMAYQRPQETPVAASGGDRYQESVRAPEPTFTPAPRPSAPQASAPQASAPQASAPQAPPHWGPPHWGPPPQAPPPPPQQQAPVPQAPVPQAPVPQAPVPQAPVPQAPPPASQMPDSSPPPTTGGTAAGSTAASSTAAGSRRSIPREPARPTEGYGTRDSQAQGGTYSGSQSWRNFWNPSASALNTSAPSAPRAYEENVPRWQRLGDPATTRESPAPGSTAYGGAGRRMAGDRFRFTRA